ncbi:MAG: cell division ATP-binding protein FtsE [Candidatus Marinimicrobia bacterium]|nr:cell division ATP-binding protein FtsE [Candidatus Neomarinimicrobiota bacterium]|tara:strand:+ start:187 stop:837 length:651 start_codon:yes stop_codon:yes gene_type:complete
MIKFNKVSVKRINNRGIYDISFNIKEGRFVYLMGPTGAGKSTIIKAIQRAIDIDSGEIFVEGIDILNFKKGSLAHYRRSIGMIFQDFKLLNDRTIFENIALPLQIIGCEYSKITQKVKEILTKVGLESKIDMYPLELSGGEQQKICVARALVKKPKIILADEPTGNLDPSASDDIIDLLEDESNSGTTIIMATHNYPLIENRIKYFLEINDGRLIK